jgi:hypothetical protein
MNRLQAQWRRLYLPPEPAPVQDGGGERVRAMVLALARPAGWSEVAAVWQGVQADLALPAPGIAVSGGDACQLWFSLAQPVAAHEAQAFLDGLCRRYLAQLPPHALRSILAPGPMLPPAQVAPERWSAFVAPDLAPLFADEPYLDHPPGEDAQAELLSRLQCTPADAFARACALLAPREAQAPAPTAAQPQDAADPRRFLLQVMQDPAVDLALRIEAAKALLLAGGQATPGA